MVVWTVWKCVDDCPELPTEDYLIRIFRNKEDAEKYCEQMNIKVKKDEEFSYYVVDKWSVY